MSAGVAGQKVVTMRRVRRTNLVRQTASNDCGAAALATVCSYFGPPPDIYEVSRFLPVDREGTSLHYLVEAAQQLGLQAKVYQLGSDELDEVSLPAITMMGSHFVVIDRIHPDRIRIGDPASGWHDLPRDAFLQTWTGATAVFQPIRKPRRRTRGLGAFGYFWLFTLGSRSFLLKAAALSFIGSVVGLAVPVLTQRIVDSGTHYGPLHFSALLITIVVALFIGLAVDIARSMIVTRIATRSFVEFGAKFLRHMMDLPWTYFLTHSTGDAVNLIEQVQNTASFVGAHGASMCVNLVLIVMSLLVIFTYQAQIGFYILAAMVLLLFIGLLVGRQMTDKIGQALGIQIQAIALFIESIRKISLLKTYTSEEAWARRWEEKATQAGNMMIRGRDRIAFFTGVMQTIFQALPFAIVMFGLRGVSPLSMGSLISVTAISTVALYSIVDLSNNLMEGRRALVGLRKVFDVLREETEDGNVPKLQPLWDGADRSSCTISLQKLSFYYSPLATKPALDQVSIDIHPGQMTAVVGPSGSGKTTLAHVLVGLLRPTGGNYQFCGRSIETISGAVLRARIALVPQECPLIEGTVLENIAFGDACPDIERVFKAAEMAQALDFILEHPSGFERRLSEDGCGLSAGQRQRVVIARALYRRPKILVLDEPTSALDVESERKLIHTLESLKGSTTIIVVAHRLRTIAGVDAILVLHSGRLVEFGSPEELMGREGYFARMVHANQSAQYMRVPDPAVVN